ncbi:TetR/AcrR family transcriptional regulator [Streptomyces chiangmaiensis]|uniref:TetR/AcrR family transcriptional regulator n=1 Tax=Streptomyces chiangmaiensis TaxID=766497 RepID=A0ABU7FU00_9ACTN|nr:TetR/AcrR family transcriptional regulator [Streptomyces chiangmaiensis]MED7827401.1 TetR/AcrR family transcriptional regulator [Streptomyces chiangmaiensis]
MTSSRTSAARARLLDTASRIFYADGIRHVGVDRIIAEAGVTRVTFYRHFPSKEDLVLAYIEQRDQQIRAAATQAFRASTDPEELLLMLMAGFGEEICRPGFRGCPFINAAAEYSDPDHPVRLAVRTHRSWFRQTVKNLVTAAGCRDSEHTTAALVLLRDGAMTGGDLDNPEAVQVQLMHAAHTIITDRRNPQ